MDAGMLDDHSNKLESSSLESCLPLEAIRSGLFYRYSVGLPQPNTWLADCAVVALPSDSLSTQIKSLDIKCARLISETIERQPNILKFGRSICLAVPEHRTLRTILLLGCASNSVTTPELYRQLLRRASEDLATIAPHRIVSYLGELEVSGLTEAQKLTEQIVSLEYQAYKFNRSLKNDQEVRRQHVLLLGDSSLTTAVELGKAKATASNFTRQLSDTPANVCTPRFLATVADKIASQYDTVSCRVFDEDAMQALGMNCVLQVGKASTEPSRFIELSYRGAAVNDAPIVLIGKGITFDTGGTTIKSKLAMRLMKYDMAGAAAVLSVLQAAVELELPLNVVVLIPAAENMPGGRALKPGDSIVALSGTTIEVLNPDAEGRLLLCDAIAYAERLSPHTVIDVATLTGASTVALGKHYSALFSNHDDLADQLLAAGNKALDKAWRLPLSDEDIPQLESQFADLANMGDGTAGCVVAALFLHHFAKDMRWAHFDVSGTAKGHGDTPAATGRPTALLIEFLAEHAATQR